jgi:hypothetical protein
LRGLWKPPDLWTRKRTRAHKVLGRRQTAAGAHSYHRPRFLISINGNETATALPAPVSSEILTTAYRVWRLFKRSYLAAFGRSVTPTPLIVGSTAPKTSRTSG